MNKRIALISACALFGATWARISEHIVEKEIKALKTHVTAAIDELVANPTNKKMAQTLEKILPTGPAGPWDGLEPDVFFPEIDKNKAAIEVLEKKIQQLSNSLHTLKKHLQSQKAIEEKWNNFFKNQKWGQE